MDLELQKYYESRLEMFAHPAWKDLMEDVQNMMDALEQRLTTRINSFVQGEGQPIKDSIDAHHLEIVQQRANLITSSA